MKHTVSASDVYKRQVLSDDLEISQDKSIFIMSPYEDLKIHEIQIKSYGSTDRGLSFLVNIGDKCIFHAGDLNWWHWPNDSPEAQEKEERDFKNELEKIDRVNLDLAFFPVDPRLGEGYSYGARYFIEKIKPRLLFPMHFADKLEITETLAKDFKPEGTKIMEIKKENQVFQISSFL